MKSVNVYQADAVLDTKQHGTQAQINGCWVLARPLGLFGLLHRIRCAWDVFQGRADILKWYGQ